MRKLNDFWHIEGDKLIKTSNGQAVPEDEPVFVIRARDRLAVEGLRAYVLIARADGCNDYLVEGVKEMIGKFEKFAKEHPERMKQPGVTRGK